MFFNLLNGKVKNQTGDKILDGLQLALDVAGLVPMFGEAADGTNAVISLLRGNYADAALSAAAMIPFAGWAATAGKGAKYALKAADAAKAVKAADAINGVAKYGDEAAELSVAAKKYVDKSVKAQTNLANKAANAQINYVNNAVASQSKHIDKVNDVVNNSIR